MGLEDEKYSLEKQKEEFQDFGDYLIENRAKLSSEKQFDIALQLLFIIYELYKKELIQIDHAVLKVVCPSSFKIDRKGIVTLKDQEQRYDPSWNEKPYFHSKSNYDAMNVWKSHLYTVLRIMGVNKKFDIDHLHYQQSAVIEDFPRSNTQHIARLFSDAQIDQVVGWLLSFAKGSQLALADGYNFAQVIKDFILLKSNWQESRFLEESKKLIDGKPNSLSHMLEAYGEVFMAFIKDYLTVIDQDKLHGVLASSSDRLTEENISLLKDVKQRLSSLEMLLVKNAKKALNEASRVTNDPVKKRYAQTVAADLEALLIDGNAIDKIKQLLLQSLIILNTHTRWMHSDLTSALKDSKFLFEVVRDMINESPVGSKISQSEWQNAMDGNIALLIEENPKHKNLMTYQQWNEANPEAAVHNGQQGTVAWAFSYFSSLDAKKNQQATTLEPTPE
ncbi:hypothetical protein L3V82_01545 [Thiotrichales bacterium 19S3-7]|nr:hypothetical protein [Thiotrichales bacterium 19S3-7]MCF6800847.1 hypothetical protein [Thiotrichales bacterium 19S3-11]